MSDCDNEFIKLLLAGSDECVIRLLITTSKFSRRVWTTEKDINCGFRGTMIQCGDFLKGPGSKCPPLCVRVPGLIFAHIVLKT